MSERKDMFVIFLSCLKGEILTSQFSSHKIQEPEGDPVHPPPPMSQTHIEKEGHFMKCYNSQFASKNLGPLTQKWG